MHFPKIRRSGLISVALSLLAVSACNCGDEEGTKASIESFTAAPMTVLGGGRTTLTWSVKDATKLTIVATPGGNLLTDGTELSGSIMSGMLTQSTTFTLTAFGAGGNATATVVVSIQGGNMPMIDRFTASPTTLAAAGDVTLSWATTNADSVEITAGGATVLANGATSGTQTTPVTTTTTFILTAKNAAGATSTAMAMVTVQSGGDPVINAFTATPSVIDSGDSSTLAWDVSGADTVTVTSSAGAVVYTGANGTGNAMVSPTATAQYTLSAVNTNNPGNPVTRNVTVSVNPLTGANIGDFSASPNPITLGDSSVLAWTVTDATRIEISDGATMIHSSTALSGSFTVNPLVDTSYTLTAFNVNGNATAVVDLTVQLGIPLIRAFTASPNPGSIGEEVTLSWDTFAADSIRILRGTTEILTSSAANGAQTVTLTATSTTFYLQATNVVGGSTAQVLVYGQDVPVINDFTVTPITFIGSTTATIAWEASSVSSLMLFQDGAPLAGFPVVATTTTTVDSMGTMHVVLNGNTSFRLVAASVAGTVEATRNAYVLLQKLEPNNTASTAIALPGNGSGAAGEINPVGDVDWYSFDVPEGGNVRLETSDGAGGCALDTLIALTSSVGTPIIVSDDDDGIGTCSLISPENDLAARNLAAGSYRVRVGHYNNTGSGTYVIQVTVNGPGCGNTFLESGEQCDDGGTVAGDGCNATCQIEPAGAIGIGQSTDFVGNLNPAAKRDFYQVTMPVEGYIFVETFAPLVGQCVGADTLVTLLDSNFTVLGSDNDDGIGACSLIDPQFDTFAAVPAGTYWVRVEESGNNAVINEYRVRIRALGQGCGNGILETIGGVPEICDDGNSVTGDGCDAVCNFEGVLENEAGGNNAYNGASVPTFTTPTVASGAIEPATDEDWYAVTVAEGQHLDVFATVGSLTSCPSNVRLRVQLYNTNGTSVLADNTTGGPSGTCGRVYPRTDVDSFNMPAGTYYIRVTENSTTRQALPLYYLHVDVIDPGCGNEITDIGENCDVGPDVAGDSCSATCAFEPTLTYSLPGAEATFSGAIDPSFELEAIQLTVTATSYLYAEAYSDIGTLACDGIDTYMRLFEADGVTSLGIDDDDGVGFCSRINSGDAFALLGPGVYWLTLEEYQLNNLIPHFDLVVSGLQADVCGNGIVEVGEQCDDGNTVAGDACTATCQIAPVATFTMPGGPQTFSNQVITLGERDYYQIEVTAEAYLGAETFVDSSLGTCAGADTLIRLFGADGRTQLGTDDNDGVDSCSLFRPGTDGFVRLMPGTYFLSVEESGNNAAITDYDLVLSSGAVDVCGNSVRESGEFCDDGNTAAGDGCTAICTPETTLVFDAPGGPTSLAGSIATVGEQVFVQINVASTVYLTAETFEPTAPTCATADTVIRLYNPLGVEVGSDDEDGVGSCSLIRRSTDTFARLTPGTWFLRVEDYLNNGTIPAFEVVLSTTPADVCGDGIAEIAGGEQCDDGNATGGDGCDATCQFEPGIVVESEPNATPATAQDLGTLPVGTLEVAASSGPAVNDVDFYRFTLAAPASVLINTYGTFGQPLSSCAFDTIMWLYNGVPTNLTATSATTEPTIVQYDDDDGFSTCSIIGGTDTAPVPVALAAGTYYVQAKPYSTTSTFPRYYLHIDVQ